MFFGEDHHRDGGVGSEFHTDRSGEGRGEGAAAPRADDDEFGPRFFRGFHERFGGAAECDPGAGFRGDTNKVTLIDRAGREELPLMSKREVAARIADKLETILK